MLVEGVVLLAAVLVALYAGVGLMASGRTEAGAEQPRPGRASRLGNQLEAIGLGLGPSTFIAAVGLVALLVTLLVLEAFPQEPAAATLAGMFTAYLAFTTVGALAGRRARQVEGQLVDFIDIIVASLEGGENVTQSLATAARAAHQPLRREIEEVSDRLALGLPIERATERVLRRYESEGMRMFTQTLSAKWYAGGEFGTLLRAVNRLIRERIQLRLQLSGQLAGARYASFLLAALPYALLPVLISREPGWIDIIIDHPLGPRLLALAVALQILGFFWLRRVLRFEP